MIRNIWSVGWRMAVLWRWGSMWGGRRAIMGSCRNRRIGLKWQGWLMIWCLFIRVGLRRWMRILRSWISRWSKVNKLSWSRLRKYIWCSSRNCRKYNRISINWQRNSRTKKKTWRKDLQPNTNNWAMFLQVTKIVTKIRSASYWWKINGKLSMRLRGT